MHGCPGDRSRHSSFWLFRSFAHLRPALRFSITGCSFGTQHERSSVRRAVLGSPNVHRPCRAQPAHWSRVAEDRERQGVRDGTGPEPAGPRWVHAERAPGGISSSSMVGRVVDHRDRTGGQPPATRPHQPIRNDTNAEVGATAAALLLVTRWPCLVHRAGVTQQSQGSVCRLVGPYGPEFAGWALPGRDLGC